MLCRAGLTPVAKVDQATGDSDGNVVRRRWNDPCSRSLARLGSLPSAMKRSVRRGSRPSRPRKISRLTRALRKPRFLPISFRAARNGHRTNDTAVRKNETARPRNEPKNAKPVPGPM